MDFGFSLIAAIIIGAATSGITISQQAKDAEDSLNNQKNYLETEKTNKLNELAENYQIEKDEVNNNATRSESELNTSAKLSFDNLINEMQGQGLAFNNAAISASQNKGNELTQIASSGARSSSMQQAVKLESAVNQAQLDLQKQQTRNNNVYQINSLLANLNNQKGNLQNSRRSFEEGGTANRKYNSSVESINNAYDLANQKLEDEYAAWKAGETSRFFSGMLGGASQAFSFISSVDTSKINFNNFGSTGLTGELAGNKNLYKNNKYLGVQKYNNSVFGGQ